MGTLSVAQLAGPTLGGLIAKAAGWQWIFWVNVPAGLIAFAWGLMILRKMPRRPKEPVDALGNVLVFAALSALLLALSEAGSGGLSSPVVLAGVGLFVLLLPLIVLAERRSSNPVLDLRLFGGRLLAYANLASSAPSCPPSPAGAPASVLQNVLHFPSWELSTYAPMMRWKQPSVRLLERREAAPRQFATPYCVPTKRCCLNRPQRMRIDCESTQTIKPRCWRFSASWA
ncbi:hypothetical protein ACFOY2_46415 [Nonomuraea purpurea]|uniref:MFS transporter n=1 Tax=Nonomuraea purpurea TaxID=1849276 RepID=A0ABV8GR99_9ACTN